MLLIFSDAILRNVAAILEQQEQQEKVDYKESYTTTYWEWPPSQAFYHITVKELFPIVLALETWGHLIANKCIDFYTDNEAVSEVIHKQSSRDETLMKLLRRLVLCTLRHNILFRSTHLPGKFNILPDLLS